jgi:TolB-like protein/Tfp pilus assembly protein PilF
MAKADDESPELLRLAAAVADGQAVDWPNVESSASVGDSTVVRELRALSELVAVHRSVSVPLVPGDAPGLKDAWGPLEIRREIGRGAYATVYLAWDPGLEREVALKLLNAAPGAEQSAAVVQEARLLARVDHPNVVRVFGIDEHDGALGLAMEFIEGLTLKRLLAERGAFSAREAALTGFDLCGAVAAVHRAGLIHRDVKTQNVMRAVGGRIVLMDFGGVGNLSDRSSFALSTKGTPLYLAPEVLEGSPASVASDVYSLGVLLFNLVTQRHPVEGASTEDLIQAHRRRDTLSLADLRPDLPDAFVMVVNRALDRDAARRFRSAGAMQDALIRSMNLGTATESFAVVPPAERVLPSIAVLPFANLGPDADVEYFCEGLAEELVTALGKVQGLRVVSRTASLRFKGHHADLQTLCRELDASTVLEGTVSKMGDKLRVSARLVNGADGFLLWSEGYVRPMDDVFAVQDDIAARVVERFRLSVGELQQRIRGSRHTDNPRAYHLYLKGRFHFARRYFGGLTTALDCFNRALAEDAGYSLAHAGLADVYAFLGLYSVVRPTDAFALASAAAERAMQIDPEVPEVQTSLALVALGRDWNMPLAMQHLAKAVELDGTQALPRIYHSWIHVLLGDLPSALALVRAAQALDEGSALVNSGAGYMHFLAGNYDEGVAECDRALQAQPNFIISLYVKGMCRVQQGMLDEAIALLSKAAAMSNRAPFYTGLLGNVYARAGKVDEARAILSELEAGRDRGYVPPHAFAYIYAALNDLDSAFEWQDRANEDAASPFNYFSPVIDMMHDDPRHIEDLRQRGWRTSKV